jgi:hypothetical protein
LPLRSPRAGGVKGQVIWICESSLVIYANTNRVFESVRSLAGLRILFILYLTSFRSLAERIPNVPCFEFGKLNVLIYEL